MQIANVANGQENCDFTSYFH